MKKLLNVMLATFLVFTVISFAVSAEDGATNEGSVAVATGNEPGQEIEPTSMSAYQDENGDLIIKGPKNDITKLVEGLVESENGVTGTHVIYASQKDYGYWGMISNVVRKWGNEVYDSRVFEQVDDTTLKLSKDALVKNGFVNGNYEFRLTIDDGKNHNDFYFDKEVYLDLGVQAVPNQEKELELVGKAPKAVAGRSTEINESKYTLKGSSGKNADFNLYWAEKDYLNDGKTAVYYMTEDKTFKAGKDYYLVVGYKYTTNKNTDIKASEIKISNSDLEFEFDNNGGGATLGTYLITKDYASFVSKVTVTNNPDVATVNKEDVVKEFTTPTGNFMSFNVTSVEPEADAEVIAKIEAGNVTPEVKTIKKDEKSVTFSVKPIDATSATKEELDTKGIWVTFSINVKGVFAEGTKVRVLHYKDGETEACETLEGVVDGSGDIVLSTKKGFSTFRVVEAPKASNTTSSTKPAGVKDTNGDGVISCDEEMGSKNWIWSESKKACVYKVSNTSVK